MKDKKHSLVPLAIYLALAFVVTSKIDASSSPPGNETAELKRLVLVSEEGDLDYTETNADVVLLQERTSI